MRALTSILLTLAVVATKARADCACGYYDPSTGLLWSERVITYWNETADAATDLITNPAVSPDWEGKGTAGETGSQNQSWVVASAPINDWEEGFSSKYRTGYNANNVRLVNTTAFSGLALDVSPAMTNNHTTWGSAIVSRRRDILYGSFRTMTKPPNTQFGGSAYSMHARFNQSETVDLGLYGGQQNQSLSTMRWSYSASGHPAKPIISNVTSLGDDGFTFLEHRFDWTRIPGVSFSNSANAGNYSQSKIFDGGFDHLVPTTPSTFSYRHYATGESSESAGPPKNGTSTAQIVYTRLFFNSSSVERIDAFEKQCAALADPICSTEDLTLRGSTPFDLSVSAVRYIPTVVVFKPKLWSIICLSIWLGISLILFLHALARRVYTRRQKIKAFYRDQANLSTQMRNNSNVASSSSLFLAASTSEDLCDVRSLVAALGETDQHSSKDSTFEQAFSKWNSARGNPLTAEDDDIEDDDEKYETNGEWEYEEEDADRYFDDSLDIKYNTKNSIVMLPILTRGDSSTSSFSPGIGAAPIIKRWKRKEVANDIVDGERHLAELADGVDVLPKTKPTVRELASRLKSFLAKKIFINEDSMGKTSTGQNKVAYLGSLRGFATLLITLGHWIGMYMNMPPHASDALNPQFAVHFPRWFVYGWKMSMSLLLGGNASFRVAMFFVLPARVLGTRYLLKGGLNNLADSSVRRLPRIMFPVFIAALLEYFLMEVSAFRWVSRLPSRTWNAWSYFEDYGTLAEFINSYISLWFVVPPTQPAIVQRYAIGVIWTVPQMVQLTWTLFLCAIIAKQIKNHYKRWSFYSACLFFNWYANKLDLLFLLGLAVADLDCKLNYRERSKHGIALIPSFLSKRYTALQKVRLPGQIFAWLVFFVGFGFAWSEVSGVGPMASAPVNEMKIRPDFFTGNPKGWTDPDLSLAYNDLKFTCILPVLSFYLLCDLNRPFAKFFSLRIWQLIGEHSFGVFLLHGAVFWSWGPYIFIKLLVAGLPYWASALITFTTSYMMLAVVAVIFTHTGDKWGSWVSVALWRAVSRGYDRRPGK